jgi:hypothetical protein
VIPPERNAVFVAAMEALLELYLAPPDPAAPLVCFDEAGKALAGHVRPPQPVRPAHPAREDPEYARHGSANLFLFCAPHLGWRHVSVTARRTRTDFAHAMRDLVDVHFPAAEKITVVLDNLNTHRLAALYDTFPPAEARRIARRLDLRYTPLHGSWLNIAEIELSVLGRQCLRRRIPDRAALAAAVAAWARARNAAGIAVRWTFSVEDARCALAHVYPRLEADS